MRDATDGQLRAYLDDELDPELRDTLAQRLEGDPGLAERLEAIRALGEEVDGLFGDEPPPLATPARPPRVDGTDPREDRANAAAWLPLAALAGAVALLAAAVLLWLRPPASGERGRLAPSHTRETVAVGDRATIVAEPGATVSWDIAENGDAAVRQEVGAVFYRVEDGGTFSVATPGGSVTVTGTCFTVDVIPMKQWMKQHGASGAGGMALGAALMLTVHEGSVVLANDQGTLAVNAGDHAVAVEGRAPHADDAELPATVAAPSEDGLAELRQRDQAQRKRIAELERRLETTGAGTPEPPTSREAIRRCASSAGSPNCSNVDPEPAVLEEMARCGTIKIDRPPFLQKRTPSGYAPPPELRALVDLSEEEIALMTEVNTKFANDFANDLQEIVAELNDGAAAPVPPGAPAWAIIPSFISAMDASAPDDAAAGLRRKIAEERAGLATPPAEGADLEPFERYERMRADVGENYEKALAEALGADRAHELRVANDGWGSNMLFGGACPDDEE